MILRHLRTNLGFMTLHEIAIRTGRTIRQTSTDLRALEKAGLIEVRHPIGAYKAGERIARALPVP